MSDGNGVAPNRDFAARGFQLPPPLKAAEMSSRERNEMLDDLVETVNVNARALTELRDRCETQVRALTLLRADYGGHIGWHLSHLSFWARLRWIVTGS